MVVDLLGYKISKIKFKSSFSDEEIEMYISMLKAFEVFGDVDIDKVEPDDSLGYLLEYDAEKLEIIFCSLANHWNIIDQLSDDEIPSGKEFEAFPTVSDLFCFFVSKKAC